MYWSHYFLSCATCFLLWLTLPSNCENVLANQFTANGELNRGGTTQANTRIRRGLLQVRREDPTRGFHLGAPTPSPTPFIDRMEALNQRLEQRNRERELRRILRVRQEDDRDDRRDDRGDGHVPFFYGRIRTPNA